MIPFYNSIHSKTDKTILKDINSLGHYSYFSNLQSADLEQLSDRSKEILMQISASGSGINEIKTDELLNIVTLEFQYPKDFISALVMFGLKKLSLGKNLAQISQFSFRELESFLRDQNDKRAFSALLDERIATFFGEFKLQLIADIYISWLKSRPNLASELQNPNLDFTLVALNKHAKLVVESIGLELVFANEQEIVITGSKIGLSSSDLESILFLVFRIFPKLQDLKVVAV